MRRYIVSFFTFATLCSQIAFAQKIYIDPVANDPVGSRLVFAFKEAVNRSTTYQMSDSSEHVIRVDVMTLDPNEQMEQFKGRSASVSVVVTLDFRNDACPLASPVLLYHNLYHIGSDRVSELAQTLLAEIDKNVDQLRKATNDLNLQTDKTFDLFRKSTKDLPTTPADAKK